MQSDKTLQTDKVHVKSSPARRASRWGGRVLMGIVALWGIGKAHTLYMETYRPQEWTVERSKIEAAKARSREAASKQQEAHIESLQRVSAPQLWREYYRNEIAADKAYKGREIVLRGIVKSIDKTIAGTPVIGLSGGEFGATIPVYLHRHQADIAAHLVPGQTVSVWCRVQGMALGAPKADEGIILRGGV